MFSTVAPVCERAGATFYKYLIKADDHRNMRIVLKNV